MRIAVSQLNYKLGDFENNFQKISHAISHNAQKADLIVFSELALSGYYPKDLIGHPHFVETQNQYLQKILALSEHYPIAIVLGIITPNTQKGKCYHNSLCLIEKGTILYTYHKRLLPVYNIFDEARHFAPGESAGIYSYKNLNIGFLICEDGWASLENYPYECNPVDDLSTHTLDLIISINGSPSNVGKQEDRIKHFGGIAHRCHAPLVFVNQVGGNDDLVFDGASFVLNQEGKIQKCLPSFEESTGVFSLNKNKLEFDSEFELYQPLIDVALFYQQIILGLQDYVKKCGFRHVVIGVSGGIDSALTLALAVKALGSENVIGIAMPSRYSSTHSVTDAQKLCQNFMVKLYTLPINSEHSLALTNFEKAFGEKTSSLTEQNIQARLRGRLLMEYSNQTGALVLSTGNKSELSVGYTTLYGDMTGGFNLIGDLYKTEVYSLSEYFNQLNPSTLIPPHIFEKAPSAELSFDQKDTDNLPEYAVLDPILKHYLEGDLLSATQNHIYQEKLKNTPKELIEKIHQMVNQAEFKRRQAPPIVRVQRRSFGSGRQFPIAATYLTNLTKTTKK